MLGRRVSRSLDRLVIAAEAVSRGDLGRTVEDTDSQDEVGRLARAFNRMTSSLRATLAALSRRESVSAVGDFAYSVAHEVRNPLTSLRLDLEIAEEKLPETARSRAPLQRALATIDRLERTVTGVLGLARSGRVDLLPIDLGPVLRDAAEQAAPEFTGRAVTLVVDELPHAPLTLRGDAAALTRMFLNLLLNAAQALSPGGSARLRAGREGDRVIVTLRDDGHGIAPDVLPHVFDPFYSQRPEGTGLGLPIGRQIARAHGGSIEIESAPGHGTVVRVLLPAEPERPESSSPRQ
jgi:signal transduction histidine kinase